MLPTIITNELFDVSYRVSKIAIDYMCDELQKYGYYAGNVIDNDLVVSIKFRLLKNQLLCGELKIDRLKKCFIVSIQHCTPIIGDWEIIRKYLSYHEVMS